MAPDEVEEAPHPSGGSEPDLTLDKNKLRLLADTFGKVNFYLQNGVDHGYLKLNGPGLYKFEWQRAANGEEESLQAEEDEHVLVNSESDEAEGRVKMIDLIALKGIENIGQIEHDPTTGEVYMLVPIEIDLVLDTPGQHEAEKNEEDDGEITESATTLCADSANKAENPETVGPQPPSQETENLEQGSMTTLTDDTDGSIDVKLVDEDIQNAWEYETRIFLVPQMSLNFNMSIQNDEPDSANSCQQIPDE
ncbi:uncharacterized protein LOC115628699 [Scaptodrosophila lebanonensis]|uniref:Uncharacterized protein LOC115628699 n=1 Tax=Drosophila lebanonensis TaxID=7225 RepID=A0A6J2TZV2_DROLE|nr:uncharacterized protein LOC115628699 [Scaptodrosophila lebanonensis]